MKCGLPPTHPQRGLPSEIVRSCLVIIRLRVIDTKIHQLVGRGKTILYARTSTVCLCGSTGKYSSRIPERDGPNELRAQSFHVAPLSHISRFSRHGPWTLADFFSIRLDHESLQKHIPL